MYPCVRQPSTDSLLIELFWFNDVLSVFIIRSDLPSPVVKSNHFSHTHSSTIVDELRYILFKVEATAEIPCWSQLSEIICEPLQEYVRPFDRIVMIPYGLLHFLPLHLLLLDGKPLIDSHSVVYAPSSAVLTYCQHKNPMRLTRDFHPKTVAAIGLDFENEPAVVAKYFESPTILLHSQTAITKQLLIATCASKDVIHFSAHGDFTPGDLTKSGLVLPRPPEQMANEYLTLRDVYSMRLKSYLITLGACNTGLGDYSSGDEVLGITRGFLYAGAPSVLASLWPVRNDSTLLLMDHFYEALLTARLDKADSLRNAALEVRQQFPLPADWAGFTLIGDWI